jgi:hypothetical protein
MAGDTSGQLQLATNGSTTALTIDTSQNVGIGTASPSTYNAQLVNYKSTGVGTYFGYLNSGTFPKVSAIGLGSDAVSFTHTSSGSTFALSGSAQIAAIQSAAVNAPTDLAFYTAAGGTVTERMRIDSSGRVTMPFQPAFYGYRTAGNVSATTTVLHNVVVTNVGSCYNSGTGIFTCPVAGVYEIYAGGHGENSQPTVLDIQLNGTTVAQEYFNGAAYGVNSLMAIISCAANDQIKSVVTTGTFWAGNISGLKMTVKLIG